MTSKGVNFHPSPGGQFSAVVDTLVRQQRAPSLLDQPPLPNRYRVADDPSQPIAAVIAAAEHEATLTSGPTARELRWW
jgi:hypothetical protein